LSGIVRVIPSGGQTAPAALATFLLRSDGITVSETSVAAAPAATAFRLYAEASTSIQTGIAIANTSPNSATVTFELTQLDGTLTGRTATLTVPANGHRAIFLNQLPEFSSLATPFQGVLRISSSAMITLTGLRGHYNERNDFLISATPPVPETTTPEASVLYLPQIVDSGGYNTQIILFSQQSCSGTIQFFPQGGGALNLPPPQGTTTIPSQ
jgi:hypothetical protein